VGLDPPCANPRSYNFAETIDAEDMLALGEITLDGIHYLVRTWLFQTQEHVYFIGKHRDVVIDAQLHKLKHCLQVECDPCRVAVEWDHLNCLRQRFIFLFLFWEQRFELTNIYVEGGVELEWDSCETSRLENWVDAELPWTLNENFVCNRIILQIGSKEVYPPTDAVASDYVGPVNLEVKELFVKRLYRLSVTDQTAEGCFVLNEGYQTAVSIHCWELWI